MTELLGLQFQDLDLPMQIAMGSIIFMFGASLGSFLAAAVYRTTTSKKSIAFDRSECTTCQRKLTVLDLVPIFSFLFLRAKCRSCKKPISWRYFWIEFTSAVMTLVIVYQLGFSLDSVEKIVAGLVLFAILLIDFDTWLIPTVLPVFLVLWGALFGIINPQSLDLSQRAIGAAAGFGFLAITLVVSTSILRRTGRLQKDETAMGWGDPILMGGIGALVGWRLLPFVLWIACIQAVAIYVILKFRARDFALLAQEAHEEQEFSPPASALPLGTFLCLATMEIISLQSFLLSLSP